MNLVEGTLTPMWALRVVLYSLLGGALFGIVMRYMIIGPLAKRKAAK